ncbi:hypothetical protein BN946_scf184834.g57 [Trametes cinnabarina]|uniref:HTH CENPB-type domain-containing protein n=1 Tax=Pycnoporus cinnabarinus TaxID=5643 RepID=A0A060S400_PYCCI|nr:hypothetical protein BN946_scf184834.g57 [Trametes cinnabarina]
MGRCARTLALQKRKSSDAKEAQILHALEAYHASQPPLLATPDLHYGPSATTSHAPAAPLPSLRSIACKYKVNATTLWRRDRGGSSNHAAHLSAQLLTPVEETVLVQLCKTLALRHLPLTHKLLEDKANALLAVRAKASGRQVRKMWTYRFLSRHNDELSMYWSSPLKTKRGLALNPTNVHEYFDVLMEIDRVRHIRPEFKFAMDESPVLLGMEMTTRVIGPVGQKLQHRLHDGSRESVSLVVTICANGTVPFPPTVIFAGQNFLKRIALSPTGYTNNQLTLEWMREFELKTQPSGLHADEWRELAVDNHGSHLTLAFLDFAASHHIEVIGYIPNSTHVLQGLDVACFGAFKTHYSRALAEYRHVTNRSITKDTFLKLVEKPFKLAFTPSTIRAAFRSTGLEPINPSAILPEQLAPSQTNSAPSAFPLELPAAVKAVLPLLRAVQSHASNMDMERLKCAAKEMAELLKQVSQEHQSETIAPLLLQPPPMIHTQSTQSDTSCQAALRASEARNQASQRIIETQNCTITLQAMTIEEQAQKLTSKEERKQSKHDKLLAGKVGRHLSGEEFRAAVQADDEECTAAEAKCKQARDTRKAQAELRKEKREWRKEEQQRRQTRREHELAEWRSECSHSREARRKPPKRPPVPRRALTPERFQMMVKTQVEDHGSGLSEEDKENGDGSGGDNGNEIVTDSD